MKKRLVTLLAGLLTVLSMGFGLAQFSDVPAGHWAKEAVEALAAKGIILGFPDGTYRGNEALTRYQAALIIYRLLQQIEEELKAKGESPTMEALAPEDLEALKNAVQELAAELAALGVRVSALEDSAATKEDIARLEALIAELKAQPMPEPGMDQAALQDLMDRVEAASVAADTALAQAQQLAERLDALAQDVEGVKGDVAALSTQVEANAQAIQALNELAVLLNQDVLALQDRVTALEKLVSGGQELPDLEQFATKEDVAAVQEFAAALRSDLVGLSEKVSKLEEQVAELNKVRYSISGSLSATYGTATNTGINFDIDRLFPGNQVSSGSGQQDYGAGPPYRNRVAQRRGDFDQTFTKGSATLTFGVKVAQPGTSGVNVSEASATLQVPAAFGTSYTSAPTIRLNAASVKGNVDGQAFSVVYSRAVSSFKFNDYLFANDNDPEPANPRQGMVATFSGTKFPLSPEVTVVAGVANNEGASFNAPAALQGGYFGIRTAFKPVEGFSLALNYAENYGNRSALGVDASLALGPVKLSGLFDTSKTWPTGGLRNFFDSTLADWAYYVKGDLSLGPLSLSANYRAIDPAYENGVAGMSSNYHYFYFGVGGNGTAPYAPNNRGFGVQAKLNLGLLEGLEVRGYYENAYDYNGVKLGSAGGYQQQAYGVGATLKLFRGFALNPYWNQLFFSNTAEGDTRGSASLGIVNYNYSDYFYNGQDSRYDYFYNGQDSRYSSSLGVKFIHDAKAESALIPGLDLTLGYQVFADSSGDYSLRDLLAYAAYSFKLGPLSLSPYVRYHAFTDTNPGGPPLYSDPLTLAAGRTTYDYTTLKYGIKVATDPLGIPLKPSLEGVYAARSTDITRGSTSDAQETYWRVGLTLNEFLVPGASVKVGYASYRGQNVVDPAGSFLTRGYGDFSLSATTDHLFTYPGEVQFPWNLTTGAGTGSGGVDGIYVEAKYYGFTVAYLDAVLLDGADNVQSYGRAFKVTYNVNF
ncbi:S-layer protein [Thermus thermophilus]|uniref:S-layer homology domain-containing protein n=1 Tax=Thermus thermophilus TaxID=274 RepID=UPI00090C30FE|nr:S-layer homology domain-containing protein [Thermus thermophilus]BAW01908.1 S-layer protein [Thermus thermophilus]BDB12494.1 S-layer protein [Thermus thermophilus]